LSWSSERVRSFRLREPRAVTALSGDDETNYICFERDKSKKMFYNKLSQALEIGL